MRIISTAAQSLHDMFPVLAMMINYGRRASDARGSWMKGMWKQVSITLVSAILLSVASGFLSSYVSLRVFARDLENMRTQMAKVENTNDMRFAQVNSDIRAQGGRIDRMLEMTTQKQYVVPRR